MKIKKSILIFLVFTLFFQIGFAQKKLTETQKLATTCKVWGFLKYYHPKVANGDFNWDNQLFEILPKIEQAKTKEDFSKVLDSWINSLGEVQEVKPVIEIKRLDYFDKNFDLSWINKNELFSKKLSQKLNFIMVNRFQGNQHYVEFGKSTIRLEIINELKYPDYKWENNNLRILAFFRYWNYVEYFFAYKYKMDQNWDTTLHEFSSRFLKIDSELSFHLTIKELIAKLDDSHASITTKILDDFFGNKWIPANFKIIDKKVVINEIYNDSLAKISDLRIGDLITKIDGETISKIVDKRYKYMHGSNQTIKNRSMSYATFNGNSDTLEIEFERNGEIKTKTICRYFDAVLKIPYIRKEPWRILDGNIGYVNLEFFKIKIYGTLEKLKDNKAIIFDLRGGQNNIMPILMGFLNSDKKKFAKFIYPDLRYPGRYVWQESKECGDNNPDYYKGKVIILVNEFVQSNREFLAMGFQTAPNVTIVGSQTSGADGDVCKFEIIDGFSTRISALGVFYPDKKETQRIGIIPDIVVKPTILGIQQGKDEILDRAIEFAKTGK